MKRFYLLLCVLGTVLPYWQFLRFFLGDAGFDLPGFIGAATANPVAAGFSIDLVVASAAFWVFLFADGRRHRIGHLWIHVAANLLIGLSLALPLYLYRRTAAVEAARAAAA